MRTVATATACVYERKRHDVGRSQAGRLVLADRKGRRFYAIVTNRHDRQLEVEPIDRRVTYRRVKAREVLGLWRKSRAHNGRVVAALRPAS